MKLISSKKAKRRIALLFIYAFMLSNLLMLIGPSAHAALVTPPSAGTCFQHTGTVAAGSLVTVYNIGTVQITATNNELTPGQDAAPLGTANAAVARATATDGSISDPGDIIGNILNLIPPANTNFVIVPGFQAVGVTSSNLLATTNATIVGAQSTETSTGSGTPDSNLAISVGIVTAGTAGVGRVIIAVARDADTSGAGQTASAESFPKSGTGTNNAQITVTGLGLAVPPVGDLGTLSGTLAGTLTGTVPSGTGTAGAQAGGNVASLITNFSQTISLCTVSSPANQLVAVLDTDSTTDLYDKTAANNNIGALGSLGALTTVDVSDTTTAIASGVLDLEPIIIRGNSTTTTGTTALDQVIATGALLAVASGGPGDIDLAAEAPGAAALALSTNFGNSNQFQITVTDDNSTAVSTLTAVDIIISSSNAGAAPTIAGTGTTQTSRHGALGALRAALYDSANATTATNVSQGASWGIASISGGPGTLTLQEASTVGANAGEMGAAGFAGALMGIDQNATEPFNSTFVDLRLQCQSATNPVAGWFATLSSATVGFGTTSAAALQLVRQSQAGGRITVGGSPQDSVGNFFQQALTAINGTNPAPVWGAHGSFQDTGTTNNALLYASCTNNTLTIVPIQNGFDGFRDILAITPRVTVSNVSNVLASDVTVQAQISGNNLNGTTVLNLAKLLGVPMTGTTSNFVGTSSAALSAGGQVGLTCSSGGTSSLTLSQVNTGTIAAAALNQCTSGAIAPPTTFFTGGTASTVISNTVVDGAPTIQGDGRVILVQELTTTGFSDLANQVGGSTQGTIFAVNLPAGCDVIDDADDNNTASANGAGGNDISRITGISTAGVGVSFTVAGAGEALTVANILAPASGADPAMINFKLTTATGSGTDSATTDVIGLVLNAQDLFCPNTLMDGTDLTVSVTAQNMVSAPTLTQSLGSASLGTTMQALSFAFSSHTATSTKGETSTNANIGNAIRLVGGGATTVPTFTITELDPRAIPIGVNASGINTDPENNQLLSSLTRGQLWLIPSAGSSFSAAPAAADVTFSDNSLTIDGNPSLVTSATIDANAPIGSVIIGIKRNITTGAADPAASTTTITVNNLALTAATSTTTDLVASVEFFSQDAGAVLNTPGAASGNNASTPTLFTNYQQGTVKALNQNEGAQVQLGTGSLSNSLLTSRLTTLGTPQLNPFAKVVSSVMNADAAKITASAANVASPATPATDNVVTVTGSAGSVDGAAQVVVTTGGTTTYDSTTVFASADGSFNAKLRGDCATSMSVSVTVTPRVSGTSGTAATKTATCGGGGEACDETCVFNNIAGTDGAVTIDEVLSFITTNGGLAAVVTKGGATLSGVIKAAKSALGLT